MEKKYWKVGGILSVHKAGNHVTRGLIFLTQHSWAIFTCSLEKMFSSCRFAFVKRLIGCIVISTKLRACYFKATWTGVEFVWIVELALPYARVTTTDTFLIVLMVGICSSLLVYFLFHIYFGICRHFLLGPITLNVNDSLGASASMLHHIWSIRITTNF